MSNSESLAITVIGRNSFEYDAKHLTRNLYIVGKFIVEVEDGRVERTVCRATRGNIKFYTR